MNKKINHIDNFVRNFVLFFPFIQKSTYSERKKIFFTRSKNSNLPITEFKFRYFLIVFKIIEMIYDIKNETRYVFVLSRCHFNENNYKVAKQKPFGKIKCL